MSSLTGTITEVQMSGVLLEHKVPTKYWRWFGRLYYNQEKTSSCVAHAVSLLQCIVIQAKYPTYEVNLQEYLPVVLATHTGNVFTATEVLIFLNDYMELKNSIMTQDRKNTVQIKMANRIPTKDNITMHEILDYAEGTAVIVVVQMKANSTNFHAIVAIVVGKTLIGINSWGLDRPVLYVGSNFIPGEENVVKFHSSPGILDFGLTIMNAKGWSTDFSPESHSNTYTCTRSEDLYQAQITKEAEQQKNTREYEKRQSIKSSSSTAAQRNEEALASHKKRKASGNPREYQGFHDMHAFSKKKYKPKQAQGEFTDNSKNMEAKLKQKYGLHLKKQGTLLKQYQKHLITEDIYLLEMSTLALTFVDENHKQQEALARLKEKEKNKQDLIKRLDNIMELEFSNLRTAMEDGGKTFLGSKDQEEREWYDSISRLGSLHNISPYDMSENQDHIQIKLKQFCVALSKNKPPGQVDYPQV